MPDNTWQRVLWKKQPHPDNHVPPTFLSSLRRNSNVLPYTFRSLISASCAITQHVSTIFVFISVFVRLSTRDLDPRILVWLSVVLFTLGCLVWEMLERCFLSRFVGTANRESPPRAKVAKSSLLVFLALLGLSPVLKTLTAATSSDSIWALSVTLLTLNVILSDYTPAVFEDRVHGRLSSVLSMNAAISASAVLASRLRDNSSVFALLLFSVQLFVHLPLLRRRIQACSNAFFIPFTVASSLTAVSSMTSLSEVSTYILISILTFVTFGAPGILLWAQKYKNEIKGPWDVAVPRVRK